MKKCVLMFFALLILVIVASSIENKDTIQEENILVPVLTRIPPSLTCYRTS